MPKRRVMIQLDDDTLEQVDKVRCAVPRAAWVRLVIEDRLRESNATSGLPEDLIAVLEDRGVMIPRDLEVFSKMLYRPENILPATTAGATDQASVAQQEEPPAFNRKRAGSKPAGRTGKGPASGEASTSRKTPRSLQRVNTPASDAHSKSNGPSRPKP